MTNLYAVFVGIWNVVFASTDLDCLVVIVGSTVVIIIIVVIVVVVLLKATLPATANDKK